jgi:uncharacterized membrane protein
LLTVTLYSRPGCTLCDETRLELGSLQGRFPHRLAEIDIESDPVLLKAFLVEIPVVEAGPYRLKAPITRQSLEITLAAAMDRRGQLDKVGGEKHEMRVRRGKAMSGSDRFSLWFSKHYLALLNLLVFLYVGLPFLAPTLMKAGLTTPARIIYSVYSPLCHQFGFRSFFLFGAQPYYPLAEARLGGLMTFEQATGIEGLSNPTSPARIEARRLTGNEAMGYKVALCERDIAIYGGILLFGLLFGLTSRRLPALHWSLWLLIGMGPIGLDGFSQIFSQFNWGWLITFLPYRESTPFLRVLTGGLFGLTTAWFAYPYIEESMNDTRQFFLKKMAVVGPGG